MAAQEPRAVKLLARMATGIAGLVILVLAVFGLTAWIGSSVARNAGWEPAEDGVRIMLATNGIHTEIVVPVDHPIKDWRETFTSAAQPVAGREVTHLGIGW